MSARVLLASAVLALSSLACQKDEASNLEKMAGEEARRPGPEVSEPTNPAKPADGGDSVTGQGTSGEQAAAAGSGSVDADGVPVPAMRGSAKLVTPGSDEDRVRLALALADGAHYRITTIGMLELPLIDKPTGFAREEDLRLSACEGQPRSCLLTHEYRNYEAEPPAGSGLEADEKQVAGLVSAHRIDHSGLRTSETTVRGEASASLIEQLGEVHRMFCIRLPAEPVGVGATWRDLCRMRQGGSLVTRELTWRLAKLEASDEGRRAELEYAGRVLRVDPKGRLINGEIKGVLYFWVDAGEPHLMRERLVFVLDATKGVTTGTDFRYQFTKVGADGEELLRTDGEPFDEPALKLNDPRSVPAGTTRDDELPASE